MQFIPLQQFVQVYQIKTQFYAHVNRRGVLSKNANQRNGFHGEVLHPLGD